MSKRKYLKQRGDGWLLCYSMAMDNSTRFEFYTNRKDAEKHSVAISGEEYIGLIGILKVTDYSEWIL